MTSLEKVVVLDFETTGLSAGRDRIIEVGAVEIQGQKVLREFHKLMDPGDFLPAQIMSITGITDAMLAGQPSPEEVMPELYNFIGDSCVVAHNASFDSRFLKCEMERAGYNIVNPTLCTLKLARRLLPGLSSYSLSSLKSHLSIQVAKSHRALDDARATSHLWSYLKDILVNDWKITPFEVSIVQQVSDISLKRVEYIKSQILEKSL